MADRRELVLRQIAHVQQALQDGKLAEAEGLRKEVLARYGDYADLADLLSPQLAPGTPSDSKKPEEAQGRKSLNISPTRNGETAYLKEGVRRANPVRPLPAVRRTCRVFPLSSRARGAADDESSVNRRPFAPPGVFDLLTRG